MLNWEMIDEGNGIFRAKVPGGWLVKAYQIFMLRSNKDLRVQQIPVNGMLSIAFIPDPNHEWNDEYRIEEENKPIETIDGGQK